MSKFQGVLSKTLTTKVKNLKKDSCSMDPRKLLVGLKSFDKVENDKNVLSFPNKLQHYYSLSIS